MAETNIVDTTSSLSNSSNSTPDVEKSIMPDYMDTSTYDEQWLHREMLIEKAAKDMIRRLKEEAITRATPIPHSTFLKYWSQEDEDLDPPEYFKKRLETLAAKKAAGKNPYPNRWPVSMSIPDFLHKYGYLKSDQSIEYLQVGLAGRVINKLSSANLITYELVGFGGRVRVNAFPRLSFMDEASFFKRHFDLKNGNYVGVIGFPGKSSTGELSIIPKAFVNLSYCLHKLPINITNPVKATRDCQRFMDLTINPEVKGVCKTRTAVVSYIRHFLENLGFLEVETPTLTMVPSGAATHPFDTYHDNLKMKLYTRTAPGHYLRQLVVGGLERVFEIGKQFRNGGIDLMANPEVRTCEFYMALAGYKDLMKLTEQILSGMVKELTGGYKVTYHANGYDNLPVEIDFTPPFRRISMIEELEKMANLSIPKNLASDEARQYLADACTKFDINCSPPQTTARLLEKLVGHFLEVTCVNPTFIIDYPEITSPLAKTHEDKPGLTERFMLFINKLELVNGYNVENDPVVQRQRFSDQLKDGQSGDEEALALDETLCTVLEYGIPPTAGWVLGIDRLTMLLTESLNIENKEEALKNQQE